MFDILAICHYRVSSDGGQEVELYAKGIFENNGAIMTIHSRRTMQ